MKLIEDPAVDTIDALEAANGQIQKMLRLGDVVLTWDGEFEYYDLSGISVEDLEQSQIDWSARSIERDVAEGMIRGSRLTPAI